MSANNGYEFSVVITSDKFVVKRRQRGTMMEVVIGTFEKFTEAMDYAEAQANVTSGKFYTVRAN